MLNNILLDKIFVFTQKINRIFKKINKFYNLIIDSNKKYNWKNFYNCIKIIINYLETLVSLSKIVNKYKKKLKNNIITKKII